MKFGLISKDELKQALLDETMGATDIDAIKNNTNVIQDLLGAMPEMVKAVYQTGLEHGLQIAQNRQKLGN